MLHPPEKKWSFCTSVCSVATESFRNKWVYFFWGISFKNGAITRGKAEWARSVSHFFKWIYCKVGSVHLYRLFFLLSCFYFNFWSMGFLNNYFIKNEPLISWIFLEHFFHIGETLTQCKKVSVQCFDYRTI